MKFSSLITAVALVAAPFSSATPKSYKLVNYAGKGTGVMVSFAFTEGWPEGSTMTTTVAGKTTKFRLETRTAEQFHFVPDNEKTEKVTITLKMDGYGEGPAPKKVEGIYSAEGKDVPIALTKSLN